MDSLSQGSGHRFRSLTWTQAEQRTYQRIERSKVMGRPERTLHWYVHMVLDKHVVPPGTKNQLLTEKDALLHHFRKPLPNHGWAAPGNYTRLRDYFGLKIIKRLKAGLKMCRRAST